MSAIRTALLGLGLLALTGCGGTVAEDGVKRTITNRGTFTITPETTWATEPLDPDGYVDYAAALNKRLREGVTPDTNANVLLWKAFGPRPEGGRGMPPEFFEEMGIAEPPEKGDYFIDLRRYVREQHPNDQENKVFQEIDEQLTRLGQRPWTAKEHPQVAAWLKANEKPLVLVVEASGRPRYYSPSTPRRTEKGPSGLVNALMPGVQKCRELARILTVRAMLHLGEGDYDLAWRDLLACHRLGRLVGQGATLIDSLVGIAIDFVAARADLAFLDHPGVDAKRIESCLRDLRQLLPLSDVAEKVNLGERCMFLDTIMMIDRYGPKYLGDLDRGLRRPEPFADLFVLRTDWDPALRKGNQWYDRMVAALRKKDRPSRLKELGQITDELASLRARDREDAKRFPFVVLRDARTRGEAFADLLIELLPSIARVYDSVDRAGQTQDNLTIAFALAWYQRDHGRYPKTLDALAPKYLRQVPIDCFSGQALVYRPTEKGYLLYSVGINGIDEGGQGADDDPPGDDLSVRMPLPELRPR